MHAMNLDDAYRVERVLASGAGGVTELVTLGGAGPFVRKKVPTTLANQSVWAAIASLDCPRVPRVQATYSLPDVFVVIYDYVPGQTLQELVLAAGRLSTTKAAGLAMDICEAAGALHSRGVIHRDLSPRNVIVAADGAHLIDLGIARTHVDGATTDTTFLGTHGFAAPEQYGFAQSDARSDVYAIGCLLGFMLTGKEPDEEGYSEALARLDSTVAGSGVETGGGTQPALTTLSKDSVVAARLAACVRKACSFEPSARFQSAAEMSETIAQALAIEGEGAPRPYTNSPQARTNTAAGIAPDTESSEAPAGEATKPSAGAPSKKVVAALAVTLVVALTVIGLFMFAIGLGASGETPDGMTTDSPSAGESSKEGSAGTNSATPASGQSGSVVSVDELPLEIAESGWSITSDGYVNYVVGLRNTSEDTVVDLPMARATGYSSTGEVLFTNELGSMVSTPNQTSYLTDKTYLDSASELNRVEFTLEANSATSTRNVSDPATFSASNPAAHDDGLGGTNFTGTVNVDGTDDAIASLAPYSSSIRVTIVLRDSSGAIVGSASSYLTALTSGTQPYSVTYTGAPDYDTAEAYAQPW